MNKAAENVCVQVLLWTYVLSSLGYKLWSGIAGQVLGRVALASVDIAKQSSRVAGTIYTSIINEWKFHLFDNVVLSV